MRGDEASREGACCGEAHLLAEHGPQSRSRSRRPCRAGASREPWPRAAEVAGRRRAAPRRRCGSASRSNRRRQRCTAAVRSRRSSRRSAAARRGRAAGSARRRPRRGQAQRAAVGRAARSPRCPARRARPRNSTTASTVERRAARQPQDDRTGEVRGRGACRASRILLGVIAKISRIVSLNWRMLEKPAANATCANGSSVVSMSTRARLSALRTGERERTRADLGGQLPVQVPLAVARAAGRARRRLRDRRRRPRSSASRARPDRRARSILVTQEWRRDGTDGTRGSRRPALPRRSDRSARSARFGVIAGQLGRQ